MLIASSLLLLFLLLFLGRSHYKFVRIILDILLQFLCGVEEYLVDIVLELAVGVGEKVLDDLVVILISRRVGDVEMELHVVGTTLEEADALFLVFHRAGLGHHVFDDLAVHSPGDVLLLGIA